MARIINYYSINLFIREYFKYNVGVICLFAFSLVVSFSYLCCGTLTSTILYVLNATGLTSMAIHRYIRKENLCDYECEMKCGDLVNLGNNILKEDK